MSLVFAAWAGPASADWRSETGTFRIGVVSRGDRGGAAADYGAAAAAISDKIGMPVEFVPFLNYPALIDAQVASRVEYAIYSATAYGTASALCECLTPLAAPVSENGARAVVAIAVVTGDTVTGLADLANARLAWPEMDGPGPDIVMATQFVVGGNVVKGDEPFVVSVVDPTAAVAALASGEADAMAGWAYAGADSAAIEGTGTLAALSAAKIDYRLVWTSTPLRFGPHAVRRDVPADIRSKLVDFLTVDLREHPELSELMDESFHGLFEPASDSDYAIAVRYAQQLRSR